MILNEKWLKKYMSILTTKIDLRDHFIRFCEFLGSPDDAAEIVWGWIESAYTEKHRHYHTLEHLSHCFEESLRFNFHFFSTPMAIEMAIWFHDIVYDTTSSTNEEDSVVIMKNACGLIAKDNDVIKNDAADMILHSKHLYSKLSASKECAQFLDIDLAILGADDVKFDRYEDDIRKEYEWVPLDIYRPKRIEILQSFLTAPEIYRTKKMRDRLEASARKNIARSIELLTP